MSAVKFVLVVGFFMHLRYDHNIMRTPLRRAADHRHLHHPGPDGALQRLRPAAARPLAMAHASTRARGAAAPRARGLRLDRLERRSRPSRWAWLVAGRPPTRAPPRAGAAAPAPQRPGRARARSACLRAARSPCCSARSPARCTTCRTTTCSARTWCSTCCWSSRCRRCSCYGSPGLDAAPAPAARAALRRLGRRAHPALGRPSPPSTWSWSRGTCRPLYNLAMEQHPVHIVAAPHDHGGVGDPVVAGALARRRAAPRAVPGADALPLRGRPAHGGGVDLHHAWPTASSTRTTRRRPACGSR